MKKIITIALGLVLVFALNSCFEDSSTSPSAKTSFWKFAGKEIWWVKPISKSPYEKIGAVPFGTTFTEDAGNGLWSVTYSGFEYNFSRTDSSHGIPKAWRTNFTWSALPERMLPDTLYTISAETKGDGGNCVNYSAPYLYSDIPSEWKVQAFLNAGKTSNKISIPKPTDLSKPSKMAVMVHVSSGYYYYLDYKYIYEWVTE